VAGWSKPWAASLPQERDPVPVVQEARWNQGPVWTGAENLVPHRDSIEGSTWNIFRKLLLLMYNIKLRLVILLAYFLYHYYNLVITFVHWTLGKYNYRALWYHFCLLFGSIQLKYSNQALRSFRCFPYYVIIILSFILSIRHRNYPQLLIRCYTTCEAATKSSNSIRV